MPTPLCQQQAGKTAYILTQAWTWNFIQKSDFCLFLCDDFEFLKHLSTIYLQESILLLLLFDKTCPTSI